MNRVQSKTSTSILTGGSGLNLGGAAQSERDIRHFTKADIKSPELADNARINLWGCNTANWARGESIAQSFANKFTNALVSGFKGPLKKDVETTPIPPNAG